ncbi:type II secretion system protein GspG, partial [Acinetobacter baumannii]
MKMVMKQKEHVKDAQKTSSVAFRLSARSSGARMKRASGFT